MQFPVVVPAKALEGREVLTVTGQLPSLVREPSTEHLWADSQ